MNCVKSFFSRLENPKNFKMGLIIVFLLCFSYWIFLMFTTEMYVVFDAKGYLDIGEMIHNKGWVEFFKTGPNREPMYPAIISSSISIGEAFNVPYQFILKAIQVGLLFLTQILMLKLLNILKINRAVSLVTLLYCGFSPALVNSAFSMFSEICTLPSILLLVLCLIKSWNSIRDKRVSGAVKMGLVTSFAFLLCILSKGVFLGVFMIVMAAILINGVLAYFRKDIKYFLNSLIFILVSLCMIFSFMFCYMNANKTYNGHFQYTNRFTDILYGTAYKRTQKVTPRIIGAHIATIPGKGVCRRFFSEEECVYCEAYSADYFAASKLPALLENISVEDRDSEVVRLSVEQALTNPVQYVLFMFYEASRMPFWESTKVGFVKYPDFLENIFSFGLFKDTLRLLVSLVTIISVIYLAIFCFRERKGIFNHLSCNDQARLLFIMLFLICAFTSFFMMTFILTRYAFPIVPIYLLSIAFWMHNLIKQD
ncbi:MAG: hypothetical protein P9X22_09360 [Candidatus Zapsychrus exili]|nr:hypothetical protein [Candidatus Zapsychrus exili]